MDFSLGTEIRDLGTIAIIIIGYSLITAFFSKGEIDQPLISVEIKRDSPLAISESTALENED